MILDPKNPKITNPGAFLSDETKEAIAKAVAGITTPTTTTPTTPTTTPTVSTPSTTYTDPYTGYKNLFLDDPNNQKAIQGKKDVINTTYDASDKVIKENYDVGVADTKESYGELLDANAVQRMITERQIAESMANAGLTNSGMNVSQITATELSYANAQNKARRQQQAAIETLAKTMRESLLNNDLQRKTALQGVEDAFNESANKFATEQVDRDNEAIEAAANERNKARSNLLDVLADPDKDLTYKKAIYNQYRNTYPTEDSGDSILKPYLAGLNIINTTDGEGNTTPVAANYTTDDVEKYQLLWNSRNVTDDEFYEEVGKFVDKMGMNDVEMAQFVSAIKGGSTKRDTLGTVSPLDYNYKKVSDGDSSKTIEWIDSSGKIQTEDEYKRWGLYLNAKVKDTEFGIVRSISDLFHNARLYYLREEYKKDGKLEEFYKLTPKELEDKLSDDDSDVWEKALDDVKQIQTDLKITGK